MNAEHILHVVNGHNLLRTLPNQLHEKRALFVITCENHCCYTKQSVAVRPQHNSATGVLYHGSQLPASVVVFLIRGGNVMCDAECKMRSEHISTGCYSIISTDHIQPAGLVVVVRFVGVRVQCYECSVKCNMCESDVYISLY